MMKVAYYNIDWDLRYMLKNDDINHDLAELLREIYIGTTECKWYGTAGNALKA